MSISFIHTCTHTHTHTQGRKPAAESTVAMKRERRKVHRSHIVGPHQSSSIVTMDFRPHPSEAWKPKPYNVLSSEDGDSEPVYISSGKSTPEPSPAAAHSAQAGVKRKRRHHGIASGSGGGAGGGGHVKKQKRSSVESRTVSVTRVSLPVYDSSSAEEMDTSRDSSVCESSFSSGHGLDSIKEEESVVHERRPRSLRVSLSIPDEVEPGTPFDKVMRVHHQRVSSPQHHPSSAETKELPSWENFENSNLLHRASSPKQRPQTLPTEKPDIRFPKSNTANVKPAPETAVAAASKNATAPSAFLASPLPISSSPKLSHPPPAVVTPSAPGANVKATSSPSPSSSSGSLEVGVKDNKGASLQTSGTSGPPLPAAVDVGYSAPTGSPDVVVATKPSTLAVNTPQTEVNNLTPSSLPPQRSPHPPTQPQPGLTKPASSSVATTPASPSGIAQSSTTNSTMLSPATKPVVFPTVTAAPNPIPVSSGVPLALQPQQQSVVVSSGHHQPRPLPTTVPPSKCTQHVLVPQQQKPTHQQQQQPSATSQTGLKTPPAQQIPSVPLVHAHQSLATVSVVQSPNVTRQQVLVTTTSRPSTIPIQQPAVVNSQRPANAPMQQHVVSRPSSNVHAPAVNQSPLQQHQHQQQRHQQQQRQVYIASTRPASIPGQQQPQQVIATMARPSSVPIQQHRPPSVPSQSPQQAVVVAPPRPSSVPMQKGPVPSHSQSRSPPVSTPTQHMLVAYSQSGVKQVVERQPPAYVGKGQSTAVFQASTSTPTYVLTHASPVNVQHGSPVVQTQRQIQEPVAKKPTVQSSGDADVIITGVESTNRVNKGQNVSYHAAVTQSGEKIVILNANRSAAVPYQTTAVSTPTGPGTVRKPMPKTVVSLSVQDFV